MNSDLDETAAGHQTLMSQPTPVGNPSREENDRPVNLPIRTKDGQEAMDPTEETSGEKIRSAFVFPLQFLLLLTLSQQERAEETSEREGT